MKGVAYSYLRFSTPEQANGDSRRRQTSLAEDYARQNDLLLDKGLNFRDLGVSAYRSRNAKQGGLRLMNPLILIPTGARACSVLKGARKSSSSLF
jgi:DNA invertase Pin-like site-specific DNA recombinase